MPLWGGPAGPWKRRDWCWWAWHVYALIHLLVAVVWVVPDGARVSTAGGGGAAGGGVEVQPRFSLSAKVGDADKAGPFLLLPGGEKPQLPLVPRETAVFMVTDEKAQDVDGG